MIDTVAIDRVYEGAGLGKPVLACGGIQGQQHTLRVRVRLTRDDSLNLL